MSWLHSTGGKFFRGGFRAGSGSFQAGVVEKGGRAGGDGRREGLRGGSGGFLRGNGGKELTFPVLSGTIKD